MYTKIRNIEILTAYSLKTFFFFVASPSYLYNHRKYSGNHNCVYYTHMFGTATRCVHHKAHGRPFSNQTYPFLFSYFTPVRDVRNLRRHRAVAENGNTPTGYMIKKSQFRHLWNIIKMIILIILNLIILRM